MFTRKKKTEVLTGQQQTMQTYYYTVHDRHRFQPGKDSLDQFRDYSTSSTSPSPSTLSNQNERDGPNWATNVSTEILILQYPARIV